MTVTPSICYNKVNFFPAYKYLYSDSETYLNISPKKFVRKVSCVLCETF